MVDILRGKLLKIYYFVDKLYSSLGCWEDSKIRAINGFEGALGIQGCYERAVAKGYNVFAVQSGGDCFTTSTAENTYNIYGPSTMCSNDGTGGFLCQEVYKIGKYRRFNQNSIFAFECQY